MVDLSRPVRNQWPSIFRAYWVVLISPFLLLAPLLLAGNVLFWGTPSLQFIPWWSFALDCLKQGSLPLWNPLNGMGAPLLANYQSAFLYPPNWFLLIGGSVGGDSGIALTYTLLAGFHLAWAGLGMSILLNRLGINELGQVIGGIAFGLSGYLVARLGFFSIIWAGAWTPWILFFADTSYPLSRDQVASVDRKSPVSNITLSPPLVACLAMQLLAGHAQTTWYSMMIAVAWITFRSIPEKSIKTVLHAWSSFLLAVLLAVGITAVQLVPTFEYLQNSPRADAYEYENAMTYSYWPWRLVTLFSPDFFGNPGRGDYWGYASYWEDHFYIGLIPLLLAISTLGLVFLGKNQSGRPRFRALAIGCWIFVLASFLLALGKNTPVFLFLYWNIPTFSMFQAPTRFLFWAAVGLPILAAIGVDRWRCPTGKGLYWFHLATAGAFAITLGAGLAMLFFPQINLTFIRATALTGCWGLCCGGLTLLIPLAERKGRLPLWRAGVISIVLIDLLATGWGLIPGVNLGFYSSQGRNNGSSSRPEAIGRIYIDPQEEYDLKFRRFFRFKDFRPLEDWSALRGVWLPDLNLLDDIPLMANFDPLVPWRYDRWMKELDRLEPETKMGWLAFSNVDRIEQIDIRQTSGVRFTPVEGAQRWRWYHCATPVKDAEEAWDKIVQEMHTSPAENRPVILETRQVMDWNSCQGIQNAQVELVSEAPDRVTLHIRTEESGWLELMDSWYPGWTATISGKKSILVPADFQFKAVFVEKGDHMIVFAYRPSGFYFAALFSILVLLFAIFLFLRKRWK